MTKKPKEGNAVVAIGARSPKIYKMKRMYSIPIMRVAPALGVVRV